MSVKFSNNGKTTLSSGVSSSATSIVVADASVFPSITGSEYFYMTLENVSGNVEILKVTSVSSNTLTAVRAQDGTSGISFTAGDKAENRLTAGGLNDVATQADTDTDTTYSVGDGGLTQKNFTTTLKTKLDGIEASANNYSHPSAHAISFITGLQTALDGKVDDSQVLTNVPADAVFTDNNTTYSVGDGGLTQKNFTSTLKTKLDGIEASANNYSHPSAHTISFITGLQTALDGKVDDSQVLTNVPENAVFTDTTYSVGDGGLTQKNFTTTLKTKLDGIATSANNYSLPFTDNSANWNTAYGWGDHSQAGYLTSYTDTNTTYSAGTGITLTGTEFSLTDTNAKLNLSGGTLTGNLVVEDSEVHVGDISADSWTRIKHAQADGYGFDFEHNNATVLVNEQGSTNEALVLGDVDANNTNSGLFGISHTPNSGTTWTKKLDLRGDGDLYVGSSAQNKVWHEGTLTTTNKSNYDTAYGWGDHADAGYLTSHQSLSGYATETYVDTAVSDLVDSSPSTLNTLNELAAALGDDENFSTTVTDSIGTKWTQDNTKISNWDTAYGWGDHSTEGYITSADGGNATTIDGYDSSRFFRRQDKRNATVGGGWMTVASCGSGRHHCEVVVTDGDSGDHAFIRIDWMRSYADSNFSVINCGGHGNRITGARVLYQTSDNTYGQKLLQVYVTTSSNYEVNIYELGDIHDFGCQSAVTPVIENSKSGYALHGSELTSLDIYGSAAEEGFIAGGAIRSNTSMNISGKSVGTQSVVTTAPTSASGFPNGHVWYVVS